MRREGGGGGGRGDCIFDRKGQEEEDGVQNHQFCNDKRKRSEVGVGREKRKKAE